MDENVSNSPDRGENAENKVASSAASESPPESQASDSKLRVVWCDSKLRDRGFGGQTEVFTFGTPHLGTPLVEVGGKALDLHIVVAR